MSLRCSSARRFRFSCFCCCIFVLHLASTVIGQGLDPKVVIDAWRQRQEGIKTFEIFHVDRTIVYPGLDVEASKIIKRSRTQLLGDRFRIESSRSSDNLNYNDDSLAIYDGKVCTELFYPNSRVTYSWAVIGNVNASIWVTTIGCTPIRLYARPMSIIDGVPIECFEIEPLVKVVGGYSCLAMKISRNPRGPFLKLVIANDGNQYPVIRYQSENDAGVVERQIDFKYRMDETNGFVPALWRITTRPNENGGNSGSSEATVLECKINGDVALDKFELKLSSGTHVTDKLTNGPMDYVIP